MMAAPVTPSANSSCLFAFSERSRLEGLLPTDFESDMFLAPIHAALGLGKVYGEYERLRKAIPKGVFNSNEALALFGNKPTRDRTLKELCEKELLRQEAAGLSHRPAKWRWASEKKPDEIVLPSVEAVCG
jgi:hypothetical protein